jgi:hypothetical protein
MIVNGKEYYLVKGDIILGNNRMDNFCCIVHAILSRDNN